MNILRAIVDQLVSRSAGWLPSTWYWSLRAKGIDRAYGHETQDHPTVSHILDVVNPASILDIGCGTGRLFPVYEAHGVTRIVGQEISAWARQQARRRFPSQHIVFSAAPLAKLTYADQEFDLCISNRVLSAIRAADVPAVLSKIARISKFVYLNEFSPSDQAAPSSYWHLHDYLQVLRTICAYTVVESGMINKQTYYLIRIERLLPTT